MLILYSLALVLVLVLGAPWWFLRMATSGKYREGLTERLGILPRRIHSALDRCNVVWVHAVSVGEVLAASRLIQELQARLAQSSGRRAADPWRVVISTTTRTGQTLARERFGEDRVFYFPLDFAWAVRAWLRALQPRLVVLVETEFWPRMLAECRRRDIPVAVVNARISDRSWPRYRRLSWIWKRLLRHLAAVLAQTELDADRLRALGAAHVRVIGNLKYDVRVPESSHIASALRASIAPDVPVLVCGSTLAGEEELLLDALPPGIVTVLAPRRPERFDEVAAILKRRGVSSARRSQWAQSPARLDAGTVFLLDSIGELASVYSLATAAFVGGSLVPAGGHNPLEAAQFAVPVLMGPSYENFRGIVDALRAHDAIRIVQPSDLKAALSSILVRSSDTVAMGERGRAVFENKAGATQRAADALMQLLQSPGPDPAAQLRDRQEARA
ncbi:MAG TPA: 3-deoxy-D-manno-octulosonic acid transferase [Acidobacteriaceae bacterium]|jgi:3-deoxy-D-manno-octulosonic-acid transferase|nr:3-deoxy-D-manno-octulosonic acid transferase [Acidobacteriaceae bacterium]